MRQLLLVLIPLLLAGALSHPAPALSGLSDRPAEDVVVELIVRASPNAELQSRLTLRVPELASAVRDRSRARAAAETVMADAYLTIRHADAVRTYRLGSDLNVLDPSTGMMITLPNQAKAPLKRALDELRDHHYGRMLDWREVSRAIPRKSEFTIIDLETGLKFRVQRRAGEHHADVQPLTKDDTAVMKRIYNGKWSWNRRAILISAGTSGPLLAASMNGMPHGGDGIPGNGFRGHFCVHFRGSTTHGSGKVDPGHQLMVHKAAGRMQQYLQSADPVELVDAFLFAVNQRDLGLTDWMFAPGYGPRIEQMKRMMQSVLSIRKLSSAGEALAQDALAVDYPVTVSVQRSGASAEQARLTFRLRRTSVTDPWMIDSIDMVQVSDR